MNIALRKLAMIEKDILAREEEARLQGYTTVPIDQDFKRRISDLMDKVRII